MSERRLNVNSDQAKYNGFLRIEGQLQPYTNMDAVAAFNKRVTLEPGYRPDIEIVSDPSFLAEKTVFWEFDLGKRGDGTTQRIFTCGGEHFEALRIQDINDAWGNIRPLVDFERFVALLEGEVRNPDVTLADEEILKRYGDTGLFEAKIITDDIDGKIRRISPEPPISMLLYLAEIYGYDTVNDYLCERLYKQWHEMPEDKPSFQEYLLGEQGKLTRYKEIIEHEKALALKEGTGFKGYINRLPDRYPRLNFGPERLPIDPTFALETMAETHPPFLQGEVTWHQHTDVNKVAYNFNYARQVSFIKAVYHEVAWGNDVALIIGWPHLWALRDPLERLATNYQRMRTKK